jgi:GNAT superfamily N-acetyltransferase
VTIRTAGSAADVRRCFPVMAQLRPHLAEEEFAAQAARQRDLYGYSLVFVEDQGRVVAVAGYRVSECLHSGRYLYVDDLVTDEARRSRGHGEALLEWLAARARSEGCASLTLESGVQRHGAHRFYLRHRMHIASYHFVLPLEPAGGAVR